jgi:hypothetical protein
MAEKNVDDTSAFYASRLSWKLEKKSKNEESS